MFGALRGQHGAFPPSSLRKGDVGAYVKKSSPSLTVLSPCAEARGLLSQTLCRGSGKGSRPWRIYVSSEDPLQQQTHLRLSRGPVFTKKQPWPNRRANRPNRRGI
jgi:hypothetical protein